MFATLLQLLGLTLGVAGAFLVAPAAGVVAVGVVVVFVGLAMERDR